MPGLKEAGNRSRTSQPRSCPYLQRSRLISGNMPRRARRTADHNLAGWVDDGATSIQPPARLMTAPVGCRPRPSWPSAHRLDQQ